MAKKLRISVFFNDIPQTGEQVRQYVTETGVLAVGGTPQQQPRNPKPPAQPQRIIDMSEVGVLDEVEDLLEALQSLGYKPSSFNVDYDFRRLTDQLRTDRPDLIFNMVESIENESQLEANVAAVFELARIPFTGAGSFTLALALQKPRVKEILTYHGIKTPQFQVFPVSGKIIPKEELRFPLIVKPSREDASIGISDESVVYSVAELRRRVRFIHQEHEQAALVEEYIDGRELNVAVIGARAPRALPVSEIDFSGMDPDLHRIVSYDAKWLKGTNSYEGTKGVCPANIPAALAEEISTIAVQAYRLIGCRDYGRVDFRVSQDGTPYLLEVNPNPDITDDAGFARAARAAGYSYAEIIGEIVASALDRSTQRTAG